MKPYSRRGSGMREGNVEREDTGPTMAPAQSLHPVGEPALSPHLWHLLVRQSVRRSTPGISHHRQICRKTAWVQNSLPMPGTCTVVRTRMCCAAQHKGKPPVLLPQCTSWWKTVASVVVVSNWTQTGSSWRRVIQCTRGNLNARSPRTLMGRQSSSRV